MAQRNGLRSFLQAGESVTLAGKVGSHRTLRKRTGEPFVKASLQTEDGISVTCVWWEAVRAPRTGSKVRVLGDVREYHGQIEVHVRQTQAMSSSTPTTHSQRLISYYIDCIEAEGIQELVLREDQAGEAFLLFTQGSEPLLTRDEIVSQPLPTEISVRSWCTRRVMTGQGERVFVGYPLIAGFIERNDRQIRSVAPLFFNECQLERVREGFRMVTSTQSVDMNPFALDLLGVSREERNGYLEGLESLEELGEAETELERIRIRVDFLASLGLVDSSIVLDPGNLSSFPEERPTLCNAALLFHGERAITTRKLLEDLEELLTLSPEALEEGPLGILLGGRQVESLPAGVPQLAILPTNLSQDRAITAAMETNFAVVTGPPGTGKSQVLVNTVAAAMESGESLLFASKNNQAVNVVFERLESVSAEAVPLRAGATRFRAELARRMAQALGRKTGIDVPLSSSRKAWAEVSTELRPIYDEESRRESLKRSLVAEEQAFEKRVADLPTALIALDLPASLSRKVAEVSKTAARAVGLPGFWPWSRRRFRKSREVFFSAWGRLRDSVPSPARATLPFEGGTR